MKYFALRFGSGNPGSFTGLSPTMSLFVSLPGASVIVGPTISEIVAGSGLYQFAYEPTLPIAFICDGGASLNSSDRFITGVLDPIQAVDEKVGYNTDSIGSTAVDPTTIFGFVMRLLENAEGNGYFDKTLSQWSIETRGGTLLRLKSIANTTGNVSKT